MRSLLLVLLVLSCANSSTRAQNNLQQPMSVTSSKQSASSKPLTRGNSNNDAISDAPDSETASGSQSGAGDKLRIQIFEGTGDFLGAPKGQSKSLGSGAGDMTLDFSDADVHDVIRSVLGEMMNVPFLIDPQVNGHVTLKTGTPITRDAIIPALEAALKLNGDAVVFSGGIYNIVPLSAAQRHAQVSVASARAGAPGFGIEVVPLKFIAAAEMQRILEPLAPGSILRIDDQRNLVFLAGTEPERASVKETIALFDTDYLKGMSFALIQPAHVDVGTLATELGKIFDETSSPIAGLVRMVPITRINTLLVITARASYLHDIGNWISRLDVAPVTPGRQLYYYRLQNARAKDVAQTLSQLYGGASASNPSQQAGSTSSTTPSTSNSMIALSPATNVANPLQPANATAQTGSLMQANPNSDAPQIVTDDSNNALIIRADPAEYASIQKMVGEMDVVPDQVLIELTIVEVTLDDQLKYGVEWFFKNANQTYTLSPSGPVTTQFPGFAFSYIVPNINVAVSALGSLTRLSVLSSPTLLTLDNKTATLEVGDQVPVVTQTATSTVAGNAPLVSTVEQRDTGVILSVTPRIGHSGMVFLDISQEVSEVIPTTTSGIDSPTIQERKLQATVGIRDGDNVALGGLIRRSDSNGDSGVPYLKDIPLLGNLFKTANDTRDRTELLIFLTPHIIHNATDAVSATDKLSKKFEDIRNAVDEFDSHKGDIPRGILQ